MNSNNEKRYFRIKGRNDRAEVEVQIIKEDVIDVKINVKKLEKGQIDIINDVYSSFNALAKHIDKREGKLCV